jgi:ATP-dependent Clp protease protease subunit
MIFLTGKTRILTPNTTIMSHQFSGYNIGKEHELVAHVKLNSITSEMIVRHLKKYTGLSEKKVKSKLLPPSDVWLSAEEAKELGICDVIEKFGD